jgi:hypothetical protein
MWNFATAFTISQVVRTHASTICCLAGEKAKAKPDPAKKRQQFRQTA